MIRTTHNTTAAAARPTKPKPSMAEYQSLALLDEARESLGIADSDSESDNNSDSSINGIAPRTALKSGQAHRCGAYTISRRGGNYSCSCSGFGWGHLAVGGKATTCAHLVLVLGGKYEEARMKAGSSDEDEAMEDAYEVDMEDAEEEEEMEVVEEEDVEEEEEEEEVKLKVKGKASAASTKRKSPVSEDEEEEDDDDTSAAAAPPPTKRTRPVRAATTKPATVPKNSNFKPLLAHKWDLDNGIDPTSWLMSEKLDGVRAIWHGDKGTFLSREGNPFYAPPWFTKRFPRGNIKLDGELFTVRGGFQDCVSIVRTQNKPDRWKFSVSYQVFDVPTMADEPFEERLKWLRRRFDGGKDAIRWVHVLQHEVCRSKKHLMDRLDEVCAKKGEGMMLRQPGSLYVEGRSRSLLKVKRFLDADAIVRAHEGGSGKNVGVCGALRVEMLDDKGNPTGKMFKIGSGFTDAQRKSPPKIGATIIYRYQELSNSGTPRFPTFAGERAD